MRGGLLTTQSSSLLLLLCVALHASLALNFSHHHHLHHRQALPGYELLYPRTNAIGVGAAAALLNAQLWVVGGSGDTSNDGAASLTLSLVFGDTRRYDVATRVWTQMAPLPSGNQAAFHSLSAYGGSLYLFGGNTGGGVLSNALLVYDVASNAWQVRSTSGPSARVGHSASVVGNELIIVGGVGANGVVLSDVWSYSFTSRTWTQRTPSNPAGALGPRYLHVAVQGPAASSVCFYGGSNTASNLLLLNNGGTPNTVHCLDVLGNAWLAPRTSPASVRTLAGSHVVGTSAAGFTLVGGVTNGTLQGALMAYSFVTSTWTSTLATPIAYAANAVANGYGYLFGGIVNPLAMQPFNTFVLAIGPAGVWGETRLTCEQCYTDTTYTTTICKNNCNNLGRCIGPDMCECMNGFTGAGCTQQLCSECNVNLLELNQPILWPRAKNRAFMCMTRLEQQILTIRSLLPRFPALCGDTYKPGTYPFNLTSVSLASWQFETSISSTLARIAQETALQVSGARPLNTIMTMVSP